MAEKNLHGFTRQCDNSNDIVTEGHRAVVGNLTSENSLLIFKSESNTGNETLSGHKIYLHVLYFRVV